MVAADRDRLDVADRDAVAPGHRTLRPDVVVHAAAWTAVDACEGDPDRAMAVNALGTPPRGRGRRQVGAHVCYLSTDYVFDGRAPRPYTEWDEPNPLSVYGRSKLAGEAGARPRPRRGPHLVGVRPARGQHRPHRAAAGRRGMARCTSWTTSTGVRPSPRTWPRLVRSLALSRRPGVFHVTNQGPTTWFGFARAILAAAGPDPERVEAVTTDAARPPAPGAPPGQLGAGQRRPAPLRAPAAAGTGRSRSIGWSRSSPG